MSFVTGSVAGDLVLNIADFTGPLTQAENLAEAFPEIMQGSLATPLRELSELAESMGASLIGPFRQIDSSAAQSGSVVMAAGQQIASGMKQAASGAREAGHSSEEMGHSILRSMIEAHAAMELFPEWVVAFWANPLLGVANLAQETGVSLVEAFTSVQDDAVDMELAAEKLGVSVKFFSEWAGVAKTVKVGSDQLSTGMYMLSRIVGEELANPTKELTTAFNLLGISQAWLNAHSNDTAAIFDRVKDGLDAMTDSSKRSWVMQELMSRGARDLIPLFNLQKEHVEALMQAQDQYGAVTTDSEARAGRAFEELKVQAQQAFEGIEKAASVPVLDFLVAHSEQVEQKFKSASNSIRGEIDDLFKYLQSPQAAPIFDMLKKDGDQLIKDLPSLTEAVDDLGEALGQAALLADKFVKVMSWVERNLRPGDTIIENQSQADLVSKFSGQTVKPGEIMHHDWLTNEWTRPDPTNASDPVNFTPGTAPPIFPSSPSPSPPAPAAPTAPAAAPAPASAAAPAVDPVIQAEMDREKAEQHRREVNGQFIFKELNIHVTPDASDAAVGKLLKQAIAKAQADAKAAQSSSAIGGQN